uniref:Uncharacterized protein n=1 Tax=uncultured marine virus TaxID=186617 RepID=A0A0F7L5U4_9VIRU|nr:hypothetical protein Deba_2546 [uncultured marine virus]
MRISWNTPKSRRIVRVTFFRRLSKTARVLSRWRKITWAGSARTRRTLTVLPLRMRMLKDSASWPSLATWRSRPARTKRPQAKSLKCVRPNRSDAGSLKAMA